MNNGLGGVDSTPDSEQFEIPDGLNDLLHDFAVRVLIDKPANLHEFAAEHFTRLRDERKVKTIPMYIIVDDDDDAGEPEEIRYRLHVVVCVLRVLPCETTDERCTTRCDGAAWEAFIVS